MYGRYDQMKDARTTGGLTVHDVIRPGVRIPNHPSGCLAGDAECYDKFPGLFDAVIHEWHGWSRLQGPPHRSDLESSRLELSPNWAEEVAPFLTGVRIEARRNFSDSPFTPALEATGRAAVERGAMPLFDLLATSTHSAPSASLRGAYHPLTDMAAGMRETLRAEGMLIGTPPMETVWAGAGGCLPIEDGSDWASHRGVYRAEGGQFGVVLNEEVRMESRVA